MCRGSYRSHAVTAAGGQKLDIVRVTVFNLEIRVSRQAGGNLVTKSGYSAGGSYDCCDIGFRARLDHNLGVTRRQLIASGSGLGEAAITWPENQGGVGDLAADFSLNLCTGQVMTGAWVLLKISGDAGTSCEGPEEPKTTGHRKQGSFHYEPCVTDQPARVSGIIWLIGCVWHHCSLGTEMPPRP